MQSPIEADEPRGDRHGEPRADDLNFVVDDGEHVWVNEDGKRVCGAKTKSWSDDYARCRQSRTMDNGRCRMHFGKVEGGTAHHQYKHGRYSKYLPEGLAERFEHFVDDPELQNLRSEIALMDTRIATLLDGLDENVSAELWSELREAYRDMRFAMQQDDNESMAEALNTMGRLIEQGADQAEVWRETTEIVDQRRKLVETENKRVQRSSSTLSPEEAMLMVNFLVDTVMGVLDRYDVPTDAKREISQATRRLYASGEGSPTS